MRRWIPVFLYFAAFSYFSAQPESSAATMNSWVYRIFPYLSHGQVRELVFLARKVIHVAAYGVAALLFFYAVTGTYGLRRHPYMWAAVLSFVTAGVDEWYQSTLPHRTGTITDVLIDGIGIFGMLAGLYWVDGRRRRTAALEEDRSMQDELRSSETRS